MTGALERVAGFLVDAPAPPASAALPASCRAAVLGAVGDVVPLAAALALTLRAADRRPAALVALWGAVPPGSGLAVRGAARLAAAVRPFAATASSSSDMAASDEVGSPYAIARGRLAWLALPREPTLAVDTLVAAAAVVDAPLVTALAGARPAALDEVVAGHDLAVAAAVPGSPLAATAIERLAAQGVPAIACRPLGRGIVRTVAVAGWTAPRVELAGDEEAMP